MTNVFMPAWARRRARHEHCHLSPAEGISKLGGPATVLNLTMKRQSMLLLSSHAQAGLRERETLVKCVAGT